MRRCAYSVNRNPVARPMLPYHLRVLRPVCTKCQHIQVKRKTLLAEWAVSDSIDDLVQLRIGRHLLWAVWACMRILYACLMNDDERSAATHIACARNKKESTQNEEMEKCFYENMTMRWRRERESECVCSWSQGEKHLLGRRLFGSAHKYILFWIFFCSFWEKTMQSLRNGAYVSLWCLRFRSGQTKVQSTRLCPKQKWKWNHNCYAIVRFGFSPSPSPSLSGWSLM